MNMIGVVLWSDPAERKAVFWCEDHGDLAFYDGTLTSVQEGEFLHAGDMVSFDVTLERKMRIAHNAEVVETKVCHSQQEKLRTSGLATSSQKDGGGKVVHFMQRPANSVPSRQVRNG